MGGHIYLAVLVALGLLAYVVGKRLAKGERARRLAGPGDRPDHSMKERITPVIWRQRQQWQQVGLGGLVRRHR